MSMPPLTSSAVLRCCGIVHPLRHWPSAVSRQIHALRDLKSFGIGGQMVAAKPTCHEMTFGIAFPAASEPPLQNVSAVLQLSKEGIRRPPIDVALDPSRYPEGLV